MRKFAIFSLLCYTVLLILSQIAYAKPYRQIPATQPPRNPSPYYQVIYEHVLSITSRPDFSDNIAKNILHYCAEYKVDPLLATALFTQESNFNSFALSPTGAIGVAQLEPETARMLGVNPYSTEQNIKGGIIYLSQQLKRFAAMNGWTATYAIAAYNAGPYAIISYNGLPPFWETYMHVERIFKIYVELANRMRTQSQPVPL